MMTWERITSRFPTPHTVYYNKKLPDGRRLAVARHYEGDRFVPGRWHWKLYDKPAPGHTASPTITQGECTSPAVGKRLAEAAAQSVCVKCRERLEDGGCTNPYCEQWRHGEVFDEATRSAFGKP